MPGPNNVNPAGGSGSVNGEQPVKRIVSPQTPPLTNTTDEFQSLPSTANTPPPPIAPATPTAPPLPLGLLEQVVARVNAVDSFGDKFGLSREARKKLLEEVDKNFPIA